MTLRQLFEWQEFFVIEPFGFPAQDMMHARTMWASLRATSTAQFKGQPRDFLLRPSAEEPQEIEVDPVEYLAMIFGMPPQPPRPEEPPPSADAITVRDHTGASVVPADPTLTEVGSPFGPDDERRSPPAEVK